MGSLSEAQQSLIIGSLLGDGAMRCKRNALLEINHCEFQQSYVDWKFRILEELVSTPPKARHGNGIRMAYRFTTRSLPELTPFYEEFYPDGKKQVPLIKLTPLALAVWFMDDGSKSRSAVYFNTQQFGLECQVRLMSILREQYGVDSHLNRDKSYFRIRVTTGSTRTLSKLIDPYLLDEFRYKLPK